MEFSDWMEWTPIWLLHFLNFIVSRGFVKPLAQLSPESTLGVVSFLINCSVEDKNLILEYCFIFWNYFFYLFFCFLFRTFECLKIVLGNIFGHTTKRSRIISQCLKLVLSMLLPRAHLNAWKSVWWHLWSHSELFQNHFKMFQTILYFSSHIWMPGNLPADIFGLTRICSIFISKCLKLMVSILITRAHLNAWKSAWWHLWPHKKLFQNNFQILQAILYISSHIWTGNLPVDIFGPTRNCSIIISKCLELGLG